MELKHEIDGVEIILNADDIRTLETTHRLIGNVGLNPRDSITTIQLEAALDVPSAMVERYYNLVILLPEATQGNSEGVRPALPEPGVPIHIPRSQIHDVRDPVDELTYLDHHFGRDGGITISRAENSQQAA